jgi:hypothetical protein
VRSKAFATSCELQLAPIVDRELTIRLGAKNFPVGQEKKNLYTVLTTQPRILAYIVRRYR